MKITAEAGRVEIERLAPGQSVLVETETGTQIEVSRFLTSSGEPHLRISGFTSAPMLLADDGDSILLGET